MEGSSRGQPIKGGPSAWGLDEMLTNPHRKNWPFYETDKCSSVLDRSFVAT